MKARRKKSLIAFVILNGRMIALKISKRFPQSLKKFEVEAEDPSDLFDHRFEVAGLIKDCLSAEDFLQEFENVCQR